VKLLRYLGLVVFGVTTLAAEIIHLKTRDIDPLPDRTAYLASPLQRRAAGTSHYMVQFSVPVTAEMLEQLRARGITLTGFLPRSTVVVGAPDDFSLQGLPVRWVGRLEQRDKISPLILAQGGTADGLRTYVVQFHSDVNMKEARVMIREHGLRVIENQYLAPHDLLASGRFGDLSQLASWDEVAYIFPASPALVEGKHVYRCAGAIVGSSTVAQYGGIGYPWNVTGPNGLTVGYYFSQLTQELPANSAQAQILRGFKEWSAYANVTFSAAASAVAPQTANILFATGAHGDPYPFDSPATLAHTFYPAPTNPEPIAGDIHFNNDERWQIGADTDLYSVALHEAGHALGLIHTDDPSDVMYPYYEIHTTLAPGDISVVQSYYGAAPGSAPSQPAPTPAALTLTVQSPAATSTTTASSVSISGTTSGGVSPVQIAWSTTNGQVGNAIGSANWTIAAVPLGLGANNITITAFDAASHIVTQTITVTQQSQQTPASPSAPTTPSSPSSPSAPGNTTPPSLQITNPASTIVSTSANSITFQGLASDNVGVTAVTWTSSTGTSGTATGTVSWAAAGIPLLVGTNTITIRAFDAAGNSAWRAVTVVCQ
jgi:hypothetical protein